MFAPPRRFAYRKMGIPTVISTHSVSDVSQFSSTTLKQSAASNSFLSQQSHGGIQQVRLDSIRVWCRAVDETEETFCTDVYRYSCMIWADVVCMCAVLGLYYMKGFGVWVYTKSRTDFCFVVPWATSLYFAWSYFIKAQSHARKV